MDYIGVIIKLIKNPIIDIINKNKKDAIMKIKSLNEMALITSDRTTMSMEMDFKNELPKLKLIADDIKPLSNKLYQGIDIFYLADKNNNYLGHIEYDKIDNDKITIRSSFSTQRGFYELMFKFILIKTPIKMIFGDTKQTNRSVKAWKKIINKHKPIVFNRVTNQVEVFDKNKEDEYWTPDPKEASTYLVGISESDNNFIDNYNEIVSLIESRNLKNRLTDFTSEYLGRRLGLDEDDIKSII